MSRSAVPAPALVIGAVVSVQFGGAIAATLIPHIGAAGTGTVRLAIAALILLVVVRPRPWRHRSHVRDSAAGDPNGAEHGRTGRRDLLWILGFGLALGGMNLAFYESLARLPIGVAVTCEFVGPLGLSAVLSRRPRDFLAVALAAAGVVAVSLHSFGATQLVGVLFALTAGACWAAYILLAKQVGTRFEKLEGLALAMVIAALVSAPLGVAEAGTSLFEPHYLVVGLAVAVLSSVLPYSMELHALRRMTPVVFGILMSLEPAVAAFAGWLVLSQTLGVWQVVGMASVVCASVLITWRRDAQPVTG